MTIHPTAGHNGGPPLDDDPIAVALQRIDDLYEEAKNFADGEPINSQEMHDAVSVLHEALHEAGKEAEALRVAAKKPLDDQIDAIQSRFNPFIQPKKGKVALGKDTLGTILATWRKKVADEKAAAAEKAAAEAAALKAAADAAMHGSSGNLAAREQAEALVADAKDAEKFARRKQKAATTGTGLRTVWSARLVDDQAAWDWACATHPLRFKALVEAIADEEVDNGRRIIPGFEVVEDKVATV